MYIYTCTNVDPQNGSPGYLSGQLHSQACTFFETLEPGHGQEKGNDAFAEGREAAWIRGAKPAKPAKTEG